MQLDQGSESQAQTIRVGFRKGRAQHAVKEKSRFKIGPGQRVFDPADAVAKVEAFGTLFREPKAAAAAAVEGWRFC